jgi:hypothetical protein
VRCVYVVGVLLDRCENVVGPVTCFPCVYCRNAAQWRWQPLPCDGTRHNSGVTGMVMGIVVFKSLAATI